MDDFDRRPEAELARMLDPVARTPAPPRRRPRRRPVFKVFSVSGRTASPMAPAAVLVEAPGELRIEAATAFGVPSPQALDFVGGTALPD